MADIAALDKHFDVYSESNHIRSEAKWNGVKQAVEKHNKLSFKPVPLPRKRKPKDVNANHLDQLSTVFENVELNKKDQNDKDCPAECFFLSVLKPEEALSNSEKKPISALRCERNYIPKNELSLLLSLIDQNETAKLYQNSLLEVIKCWLLNATSDSEVIKSNKNSSLLRGSN